MYTNTKVELKDWLEGLGTRYPEQTPDDGSWDRGHECGYDEGFREGLAVMLNISQKLTAQELTAIDRLRRSAFLNGLEQ